MAITVTPVHSLKPALTVSNRSFLYKGFGIVIKINLNTSLLWRRNSNYKIQAPPYFLDTNSYISIYPIEKGPNILGTSYFFKRKFYINRLSCFFVTFNPRSYFYETYNSTGNYQSFQHVIFLDKALNRVSGFKLGYLLDKKILTTQCNDWAFQRLS